VTDFLEARIKEVGEKILIEKNPQMLIDLRNELYRLVDGRPKPYRVVPRFFERGPTRRSSRRWANCGRSKASSCAGRMPLKPSRSVAMLSENSGRLLFDRVSGCFDGDIDLRAGL